MLDLGATATQMAMRLAAPTPTVVDPAGRTIRISLETKAMNDPSLGLGGIRQFSPRLARRRCKFQPGPAVTGSLLESREANETADAHVLNWRRGATWDNGNAFDPKDVMHNLTRWAEGDAAEKSMASRVSALVDADTNRRTEGATHTINDYTIRLKLKRSDIRVSARLSGYPAEVMHCSFTGGNPVEDAIGKDAYIPERYEIGVGAVLVRNPDYDYWREGG